MTKWKKVAFAVAVFALCCLFRYSNSPYLAFGLFVGAVYCVGVLPSVVPYIVSAVFFSLDGLITTAVQAVIITSAVLIHAKANKRINKWLLLLYVVLANVFPLVWKLSSDVAIQRILHTTIAVLFSFVSVYVMRALVVRGFAYRLATDEALCLACMGACIAKCLLPITLYGINPLDLIAPFAILAAFSCFYSVAGFCVAVTLGIGGLLATASPVYICVYVLFAFAAFSFYPLSRYASAFSVLLVQLAIIYFFDLYGNHHYMLLLPTFVGCVAYCLIPTKKLAAFASITGKNSANLGVEPIVNRLRGQLADKLYQLADVFYQMQNAYKSLMGAILSPEKAVPSISRQVAESVCADCPEKNRCWRGNVEQTENVFNELAEAGLDKGKATLIDIPDALASACLRLSTVLACVNKEVASYKQYYGTATTENNGKLLLAEQLGGISNVMLQLSSQCKRRLTFDRDKERRIVEELTFLSVLVKEAVVCTENSSLLVTLTVAEKDADKSIMIPVLNKIIGAKLTQRKGELSGDGLWRILFFTPSPRYNVTFGYAQRTKDGSCTSGDTHSFLRLSPEKFMLLLCDGMGSGRAARDNSERAIALVENFYKADFDSELVLSSVNKLLSAHSEESFTALDACVIDLQGGGADFIKLGCPDSLIKTAEGIQFIKGGSLPLGVLKQIKPVTTKKALIHGDIILMFSDGLADCFADKTEIAQLLEQNIFTNMQLMAQNILQQALERYDNQAQDDITVLAARIIEN